MPTKVEKDAYSGTDTTGHEWDGIRELDTPIPKWWVYTLYASIIWAVALVILYPAIPGISSHTKGLLGWSTRDNLAKSLVVAREAQSEFLDRIELASAEEIMDDSALFVFAQTGGKAAFADNCAPCHAPGGAGRPGFPVLADDDWLWGGTLSDIAETINFGVRAEHDESRFSEMPPFDGVFSREEMADLSQYVLSLSRAVEDLSAVERGAPLYADNCVACHEVGGIGNREFGAPRLSDHIWLYADAAAAISSQINAPNHGVMPAWGGRLDESTIKMLTVYVHALGGGE
ncbi:MAG: cytochrome-c oxidase, cbb3-type subunit III [Alphaproteobacteria bacterium]